LRGRDDKNHTSGREKEIRASASLGWEGKSSLNTLRRGGKRDNFKEWREADPSGKQGKNSLGRRRKDKNRDYGLISFLRWEEKGPIRVVGQSKKEQRGGRNRQNTGRRHSRPRKGIVVGAKVRSKLSVKKNEKSSLRPR